ncbi:hypothetical protein, partial [Rhizobium sophoriradicis]|uniref:hypothetical protein n=1 Tax=Rhizobium sophoriradicis TaxID=1535245 RepID=UPI001AEF3EBC
QSLPSHEITNVQIQAGIGRFGPTSSRRGAIVAGADMAETSLASHTAGASFRSRYFISVPGD